MSGDRKFSYEKMEGIELQEKGGSSSRPSNNNNNNASPPISNPPPSNVAGPSSSHHNKTVLNSPALAIASFLFAAAQNDIGIVQNLLDEETVRVNDCDYDKRTALHVASSEGHIDVVRILLREGADVNCHDRYNSTPLDDAVHHGHQDVAKLLQDHGAKFGSGSNFALDLVNAAGNGDLKAVQRLVQNGISVNSSDYDLRTPLHVAIAGRHHAVVQYLLQKGADLNAEDRFGGTPYEEAHRAGVRLGNDPILELVQGFSGDKEHHSWRSSFTNTFVLTFIGLEFLIGILWAIFAYYGQGATPGAPIDSADPNTGIPEITERIPFYMDVHVMIFIGFGFLMTFLRKYGYTAVGLTFILGALSIQVYHLTATFWGNIIQSANPWVQVLVNIETLIRADFAAGAVLISFGALLGKVSFTQMMILSVFEVFWYSLNEAISIKLEIADIGGSMVIHTFGAFFGLAASAVLTPSAARGNRDNAAIYHSDIFSMVGTVFLWIFWPSFNAALSLGNAQHRAVVNTVLSLTASVVFAFIFSQFWRREKVFSMVDIQNATLAGGVAMGSAADMAVHPAFALLIGAIAGTVSVFGFSILQGVVENHLRIHDTCGVLNLHGIPGIIGGLVAVIASAAGNGDTYNESQLLEIWSERDTRDASKQAKVQFAFLIITLAMSIITGLFSSLLVSRAAYPKKFFVDSMNWETPARELPYYFDIRGEARHSSERNGATEAPTGEHHLGEHQLGEHAASPSGGAASGETSKAVNELQTKITALENMIRSQRKTLRDQSRAIESISGGTVHLASGQGSLSDDESSSLLLRGAPAAARSSVIGGSSSNLASMLENLTQKVNFLVDSQKNK